LSISVAAEEINPYGVYGIGSLEKVKEAVKNGANVNKNKDGGTTPLMYAALFNDDPEVIMYLLDQGADYTVKTDKGKNLLELIESNDSLVNTIAHKKIAKLVTGEEINIKEKEKEINIKAYRSLEFGDPPKVVEEKIEEKDEGIKLNSIGIPKVEIAGNSYTLFVDYYKDKLYRVGFDGEKYSASYFDTTIKDERNKLVKVIKNQYGDPTYTDDLSVLDMSADYITWSHVWELDKKKIYIGIGQTKMKYYTGMQIDYIPLLNEKEKGENEKENEDIKNDSSDF